MDSTMVLAGPKALRAAEARCHCSRHKCTQSSQIWHCAATAMWFAVGKRMCHCANILPKEMTWSRTRCISSVGKQSSCSTCTVPLSKPAAAERTHTSCRELMSLALKLVRFGRLGAGCRVRIELQSSTLLPPSKHNDERLLPMVEQFGKPPTTCFYEKNRSADIALKMLARCKIVAATTFYPGQGCLSTMLRSNAALTLVQEP